MSTIVCSLTVPIAPVDAPAFVHKLDDITPFFKEENLHCYSVSRNDALRYWLRVTLDVYSAAELKHLLLDGTMLGSPMLDKLILAIEALLKSIEADPIDFLAKLKLKDPADYYYEPEASRLYHEKVVHSELVLPATLPRPQGNYDDEGDGWAYMIGFLKSHRELFIQAKRMQQYILLGYSMETDNYWVKDPGPRRNWPKSGHSS